MNKDNFIDLKTGETFYINCYTQIYTNNGIKFYNKGTKIELTNPLIKNNVLSLIPSDWDGEMPNFGKFSSMSKEEKSASLKKRSKEHSKQFIPNNNDI